eukprot:CAMPEP_0119153998 /NCGR_PEP_ID=MMETSP1310-20130426/50160_1 /TAXON_ID=464262 /ORGANISM="Genus nov. species nov., Strain RCC2339" /LENGTH=113 /DNA_ID=CAMNT_0007146487 /DNA_START=15 /DNA_END=353 /DNA_ORIENTATION=+
MTKFMKTLAEAFAVLKPGEVLLLPGGWTGLTKTAYVVYLVEKEDDASFALTVCNSGEGLEYHPSKFFSEREAFDIPAPAGAGQEEADHLKLRYQTCLRLPGIAASRITDMGFW